MNRSTDEIPGMTQQPPVVTVEDVIPFGANLFTEMVPVLGVEHYTEIVDSIEEILEVVA